MTLVSLYFTSKPYSPDTATTIPVYYAKIESPPEPHIKKTSEPVLSYGKTIKADIQNHIDELDKESSHVNAPTHRDFDSELYEEKSQRVHADKFGNHHVNLRHNTSSVKRYLVSNWPIYSPTPQEQQDGSINGCMSLNYYVSLDAFVTLVVEESQNFRMYHYQCSYDNRHQSYQLIRLSGPPRNMLNSIQNVVDKILLSAHT